MKSKHALIICNGEAPSRTLALRLAAKTDVIVAADGGANIARVYGITPDIIIGDLDSITPATKRFFSSSSIAQVKRQDNTDLEKALDYVRDEGIQEVTILGATGNRMDFTLGNMSVVWNYVKKMRLRLVGDGWSAMPVQFREPITARVGTTVSLIPFGNCSGITLKGLKYPLTNATMNVGEIGVSNVVRKSPFTVSVRRGKMMLFIMERQ